MYTERGEEPSSVHETAFKLSLVSFAHEKVLLYFSSFAALFAAGYDAFSDLDGKLSRETFDTLCVSPATEDTGP